MTKKTQGIECELAKQGGKATFRPTTRLETGK